MKKSCMNSNGYLILIALWSAPLLAADSKTPSTFEQMVPMIILFVAFYFLMIRPQAQKTKEHEVLIKNLKPGDEVITSAGMIAKVKAVHQEFVSLDIGQAQIKILPSYIKEYSPNFAKIKEAKEAK